MQLTAYTSTAPVFPVLNFSFSGDFACFTLRSGKTSWRESLQKSMQSEGEGVEHSIAPGRDTQETMLTSAVDAGPRFSSGDGGRLVLEPQQQVQAGGAVLAVSSSSSSPKPRQHESLGSRPVLHCCSFSGKHLNICTHLASALTFSSENFPPRGQNTSNLVQRTWACACMRVHAGACVRVCVRILPSTHSLQPQTASSVTACCSQGNQVSRDLQVTRGDEIYSREGW